MIKIILRGARKLVQKVAKGQEYPHFNWTSDMDDHGGCDRCPIQAGRWWLNLTERIEISSQWLWFLPKRNTRFGLSLGIGTGENADDIQLAVFLPWICSIYTSVGGLIKPVAYEKDREWDLMYHTDLGQWGCFTWRLGLSPNSWDMSTPRWKRKDGMVDIADLLMGRHEVASEILDQGQGDLHVRWAGVTEHYACTWKQERMTWTRTRFKWAPMTISKIYFDIKVPGGVPFPGKGENSWDCGDDATYSMSCEASSINEACEKFAADVIQRREEHGGSSWRVPTEVTA